MAISDIAELMMTSHPEGIVVVAFLLISSLIQIAPIRLNPWDIMLGWVGAKINKSQQDAIEGMDRRLKDLEIRVTNRDVKDMRQAVLDYAKECRAGTEHTDEDWQQILDIMEEYERFCTEHPDIKNGRVKENTKYLRSLYFRLSDEHRLGGNKQHE